MIPSADFIPGKALANQLWSGEFEAVEIAHVVAEVVTQRLLVQITKQVERLNRNVGTVDAALQKRPVVFESVGMDVPVTYATA